MSTKEREGSSKRTLRNNQKTVKAEEDRSLIHEQRPNAVFWKNIKVREGGILKCQGRRLKKSPRLAWQCENQLLKFKEKKKDSPVAGLRNRRRKGSQEREEGDQGLNKKRPIKMARRKTPSAKETLERSKERIGYADINDRHDRTETEIKKERITKRKGRGSKRVLFCPASRLGWEVGKRGASNRKLHCVDGAEREGEAGLRIKGNLTRGTGH